MLVSITGPSGVGKGYVKEQLVKNIPSLRELVWFTTRPLRPTERDGSSNRSHISRDEFEKLMADGKMLFCQELFGNLYGIYSDDLCHSESDLRITEFHIDNVVIARESSIEFIGIAIVPHEVNLLSKRLLVRSTESKEEIQERLRLALIEIETIRANSNLFDLLITVSESNQGQIAQEVISKLVTLLKGRV